MAGPKFGAWAVRDFGQQWARTDRSFASKQVVRRRRVFAAKPVSRGPRPSTARLILDTYNRLSARRKRHSSSRYEANNVRPKFRATPAKAVEPAALYLQAHKEGRAKALGGAVWLHPPARRDGKPVANKEKSRCWAGGVSAPFACGSGALGATLGRHSTRQRSPSPRCPRSLDQVRRNTGGGTLRHWLGLGRLWLGLGRRLNEIGPT